MSTQRYDNLLKIKVTDIVSLCHTSMYKMFRITPMHVIYDEAHMLKNMSTQRYDNLLKIKVTDIVSLCHTSMYKMFRITPMHVIYDEAHMLKNMSTQRYDNLLKIKVTDIVSLCHTSMYKMFRITPMHYVIYDEAHMLKNMSTQRYDNLLKIKSKHRLLLTGTPLQNNLLELMSLLCFVMPHMFSGKTDDLKSLFQKNAKYKGTKKTEGDDDVPAFEKSQITQAKRIMKPFVLRRLKRDVLQDLPKKTNHTELCKMSAKQERLYKELCAGFAAKDGTLLLYSITLQDLPKKTNHTELCKMSAKQERLYKELCAGFAAKDGTVSYCYAVAILTTVSSCYTDCNKPKKTNHTELCKMSAKQERLYKELCAGFAAKDGTVNRLVYTACKTNHTELCKMSTKQERLYKELCAGFAAKDGTVSYCYPVAILTAISRSVD
ncbi:hypothetical protein NE865_11503 [Phthorimaea operculella]|nr:hypothetical protein NE865_11503 [Phthorimaea operculella]